MTNQAKEPVEPKPPTPTTDAEIEAAEVAKRKKSEATERRKKAAEQPEGDLTDRLAIKTGIVEAREGDKIVFEIGRGWRLAGTRKAKVVATVYDEKTGREVKKQVERDLPEELTRDNTILAVAVEPFTYDAETLAKYHTVKFKVLDRYGA